MATREENLAKINASLEKLSDEQLEKIASEQLDENELTAVSGGWLVDGAEAESSQAASRRMCFRKHLH